VIGAVFAGMRFPRSMLAGPANERLLRDAELEDFARAWLAMLPAAGHHNRADSPATSAVRRALERRAAA
jgi:hypothetical protein